MTGNSQPAPEITWVLDDLYIGPADPRLDADLERVGDLARSFAERYRGRVAHLPPRELLAALQAQEEITTLGSQPWGYASLAFAAQTQAPETQALLSRVREIATDIFNQIVFFDVELKAASDEVFERLLAAPELANYRHHLQTLRAFAPHTLSEPEERLFARMRLTGASAWSQLYTEVTSGLRFPIDLDGETKLLTDPEMRALRTSPDRDLRRRATESLYSVYGAQGRVLTYVFNTLFQDHRANLKLRSYADPIEPTALANELSPGVIERLLSEVEARYGLAQRYYQLKASLLGLAGDFRSYDVLAPLRKEERKFEFAEAREMVLEAFDRFDPRTRQIAALFFEHRWIDATPRQGKRGGAFCSGLSPAHHPYVLTNFTGRLEDAFTLAHELGHGIHFQLSRAQTLLNYGPTTPMAEVASVFGEILLASHLREKETNPSVRRDIVSGMIEDAIATIFRQTMYTRWEQRAHARRAQGVATTQDYSALWAEESARLFGDSVVADDMSRIGWITIPHFVHYRFYCYSYAFGHLLNFALYRKYLEEGPAFVQGYLDLLTSGGRDRPEKLLEPLGLNPLEPGFWEKGFRVLEGLLAEFEGLATSASA